MKLALISSPGDYRIQEHGRLGYHLVLAQEYLTDNAYQAIYNEKRRQGDFIIMDNGAAEYGRSIRFTDVLTAADAVDADEVCLPDVIGDPEGTFNLHYKFFDQVPEKNRMIIPQGKDGMQWMECLDNMMEVFGFYSVGIPKHLDDDKVYNRAWILDSLQKRGDHVNFHIHLLGCHHAPLYEVQSTAKKFPWVRGIDTAAPFAYAQNGQSVSYAKHFSYSWNRPTEDVALAARNINDLLEGCNGAY